ncbi:aspartate-semialdehyde dehydrogenase [soil metagenome]
MTVRTVDLAVVGATGLVGEAVIAVLAERSFPVGELHLLATADSEGRRIDFRGRSVRVQALDGFDFSRVPLAVFAAGQDVAAEHAPRAADAGCLVVDHSSRFRHEPDVPLVVPEVNAAELALCGERRLVANPNCSTIQLVVALKPLYDAAGLERVNVATYQSVSGGGRALIEALSTQTARLMNGLPLELPPATKQIAFNVLPQIDGFEPNGYTREEMKIVRETRRIFDEPELRVNATAVRVPVFYGHSEAVQIETIRPLAADEARALLARAPGVCVLDDCSASVYPTAVTEAANCDTVFVGRIREDMSHPRGLNLWIVADNVRKGAATNSVQILEILAKDYL